MKRRFSPSEESFNQVLAKEMHRYSEDYSTITIRKGELDEFNSIGVGCSGKFLELIWTSPSAPNQQEVTGQFSLNALQNISTCGLSFSLMILSSSYNK